MRKNFTYLFFFVYAFASSQVYYSSFNDMQWKFREVGTKKFYPAKVPGTIHTDLITNHLIPHPYYETSEQNVQWVEERDWEYLCEWEESRAIKNFHHEFVFQGLDTYAKVFLNGKQVLRADNMFLEYRIDVTKQLKKGKNKLNIVFESAVKHGKAEAKKLPYVLPGGEKVFTRKAQYQYGWDWGPRLVTCGIYKSIGSVMWKGVKIKSFYHKVNSLTDTLAEVYMILETESDTIRKQDFRLTLGSTKSSIMRMDSSINVKKGINRDSFLIKIPNPPLWNCHSQGNPDYLRCHFQTVENNHQVEQTYTTFGLRTIELVKQKDTVGETFYFKINGKPTFMKGANFIPPDNFIGNRHDESYYNSFIQKAKDSNINMLRVWGGGLYLDDVFYDLCDRAGILVWQDFMFACAMYPGDSTFLNNVQQEAGYQVKRLRSHPCLALWCGNNENNEGWHNWGWHKQYNYSKTDSAKIWSDYQKLFHKILPDAVQKYDSKTPYVASSPMLGWGRKESLLRGDSHYWGVWWGMEPFEIYDQKVGRFMSEYGFQSIPDYFTLKKYGDTLSLNSSYIKAHQKHPTGYQTINTYMGQYYHVPKDFFNYVYTSQLLQRDGMQTAIEAHRRNKPYCMGTLYWQWNDCWPVTSWSAVDYGRQPKALYYATKNLYANFCISIYHTKNRYDIYVVSDSLQAVDAVLQISLKNTKGETLFTKTNNILIKENSSGVFKTITENELMADTLEETDNYGNTIAFSRTRNKNELYLSCDVILNHKTIAHKNYFFVKPKDIKLYEPEVNLQLSPDHKKIRISSKTFVKDLYLFTQDRAIALENNFIEIEPDKPVEIQLPYGMSDWNKEIKHVSLYDLNIQ